MFAEELTEIEEQLKVSFFWIWLILVSVQGERENTLQELDEKLELLIEMLKNRKDTLAKSVKSHYKK